MDNLSPHRTFVNLDDTRGLPEPHAHTPVPHREHPLPGTKTMLCPKDPGLAEKFFPRVIEPSAASLRAARVLAWLAVVCAAGMIAGFWKTSAIQRTAPEFLMLAVNHVGGLFAGILSGGRVRLGYWAIGVIYAAYFASMLVNHLFP